MTDETTANDLLPEEQEAATLLLAGVLLPNGGVQKRQTLGRFDPCGSSSQTNGGNPTLTLT